MVQGRDTHEHDCYRNMPPICHQIYHTSIEDVKNLPCVYDAELIYVRGRTDDGYCRLEVDCYRYRDWQKVHRSNTYGRD